MLRQTPWLVDYQRRDVLGPVDWLQLGAEVTQLCGVVGGMDNVCKVTFAGGHDLRRQVLTMVRGSHALGGYGLNLGDDGLRLGVLSFCRGV